MAVSINLSIGNLTSSPRSISNADGTRLRAAVAALYPDKTEQQIIDIIVDRLIAQGNAITKNFERSQQQIADISVV